MDDDIIDVSDEAAELSQERIWIAHERACRAIGYDPEDSEDEEYFEAFRQEIIKMIADDIYTTLMRAGLVDAHTDESGEVFYTLTQAGEAEIGN
jgi:hypothetical protein